MAYRGDPEKIYQARRSALFRTLTATGNRDGLEAGHRIAPWERSDEAAAIDQFTPEYWETAERWLLEWTKRTITGRVRRSLRYSRGSVLGASQRRLEK